MNPVYDYPTAYQHLYSIKPQIPKAIWARLCHCGTPLRLHKRCKTCSVLIGRGHEAETDEEGYCPSCVKWAEKR